jgi:hypothetical protein
MKINFINKPTGEIRQLDLDRVREYKDPIGKIKRVQKRFVKECPNGDFLYEIMDVENSMTSNFDEVIAKLKELL